MRYHKTALLGLAAPTALASPTLAPSVSVTQGSSTGSQPTVTASLPPVGVELASLQNLAGGEYTVTLVNLHTVGLTTKHGTNPGKPTAIWAHNEAPTLARNSIAVFALPTGWGGGVSLAEEGSVINGGLL
ncbi:Uu.00g008730.m01.CDS01 [Anthostomella pinea]|uniref:Uu.00g008730.m01.CDS01 n=1 Tax=Anthostomella pinea TaxID=933095 RepID=A0AAI8YPT7_9PEZI|nr:Uu.00g008730.m01.CDS01 [Anthostomella pinea]